MIAPSGRYPLTISLVGLAADINSAHVPLLSRWRLASWADWSASPVCPARPRCQSCGVVTHTVGSDLLVKVSVRVVEWRKWSVTSFSWYLKRFWLKPKHCTAWRCRATMDLPCSVLLALTTFLLPSLGKPCAIWVLCSLYGVHLIPKLDISTCPWSPFICDLRTVSVTQWLSGSLAFRFLLLSLRSTLCKSWKFAYRAITTYWAPICLQTD